MKVTKMTIPMTVDEIRAKAKATKFEPVTFIKDGKKYIKTKVCSKCKGKMLALRSTIKTNKYHTIHACTCGYKECFGYGYPKKKGKKPIKITNKCVKKDCSNDLPEDRKSYCYTCRPKTKQSFKM